MSTLKVKGISAPTGYDLQMPAGHILQTVSVEKSVANNSNNFFIGTNSTSWSSVPILVASITPSSTSSKILVMIDYAFYHSGNSETTIYRGSTRLGGSTYGMARYTGSSSFNAWTKEQLIYLDSPSSTSSITYALGVRVESGTSYVGGDTDIVNTITLQEVAG